MMTMRAALKSSGLLLQDSSSESDSDDSYEYWSFMTYTVDLMTPCILSRRLYQSSQAEPVAFVDGGADTGCKANLVGYDDRHTKKSGLDICTLVMKV